MPIYEFSCNACGAAVSVFVRSMNSPLEPVCERCGSRELARKVSTFASPRSSADLIGGAGDYDDGMFDDMDDMADWD